MSVTVSIVVAAYNYGRYVAAALDSALAQTYRDVEIVVVDDGSTDDTEAVLERYRGVPGVRCLRTPHVGQPAAKNAGIRASTGSVVAFLDADDLWLPEKLEKQMAVLERGGPRVGVVYCRRRWIDAEGRSLVREERQPQRGSVLAPMFHRPFVCFSSTVVRRSVLDDVGLFDESLPMSIDYDLWLRVAMKYDFDYVDEPLVLYRTGHANLSSRQRERAVCVRRIIHRFLDERGGRARLAPAFVRRVLAEHFCDTAEAEGGSPSPRALAWYARALATRPLHGPAWKALAMDWWLRPARSLLRRRRATRPAGSR